MNCCWHDEHDCLIKTKYCVLFDCSEEWKIYWPSFSLVAHKGRGYAFLTFLRLFSVFLSFCLYFFFLSSFYLSSFSLCVFFFYFLPKFGFWRPSISNDVGFFDSLTILPGIGDNQLDSSPTNRQRELGVDRYEIVLWVIIRSFFTREEQWACSCGILKLIDWR